MIPTYLQGKSAAQIVGEQGHILREKGMTEKDYILHLEMLLLIAVKDALCNCDEIKELIQDGEYLAQQRAIAFLNMVLPYKEGK